MMNVTQVIQDNLKKAVSSLYSVDISNILVEHPKYEDWGDYATNLPMVLANKLNQSPVEIAKSLTYELESYGCVFEMDGVSYNTFERVYFAPPGFINFVLSKKWLYHNLFSINSLGASYGSSEAGQDKKILIEYSQPNPNKPLHIGHARNNFLGSSISNILSFVGYDVTTANYVNNWGTHIVKAMLMYKKHGNGSEPDKQSDHFVGDFYAMYEQEEHNNPSIKEEVAEMFQRLEASDPEVTELWKKIVGWTIDGWKRTYGDQGIEFDTWFYQSDYTNSGKDIVNLALEKGIAEKDESGAIIARLEKYDIPDKVLLRADGTSLYSTQDLQMAKDNIEQLGLDSRVYVVDYRQSDYFRQLFKILEIFGFSWATRLHHLSYGTVELPEGKMSSRKGLVINSDEVFEKLIAIESLEISSDIDNRDEVIKKVAMAAFKYALLKFDPNSNIIFKYEDVTKFSGNTGPYLMYSYARATSILEKSTFDSSSFTVDMFNYTKDTVESSLQDKEMSLLRYLYRFQETTLDSAESYAPSVLCTYLFELAQRFNSFYNDVQILSETNEDIKNFRLLLTHSTAVVLKNGLTLLGISVSDRM